MRMAEGRVWSGTRARGGIWLGSLRRTHALASWATCLHLSPLPALAPLGTQRPGLELGRAGPFQPHGVSRDGPPQCLCQEPPSGYSFTPKLSLLSPSVATLLITCHRPPGLGRWGLQAPWDQIPAGAVCPHVMASKCGSPSRPRPSPSAPQPLSPTLMHPDCKG